MVLDILGEAVLSAVLGPLFDSLSSPLIESFFGAGDRQKLLEKLRRELLTIDAVLSDAEEKQITNSRVREWVNQLKDAAYQADDLLDEIDTLRRKLEDEAKVKGKGKVMGVMAKKVRRLFPTNSPCDEDEESSLKLGKKIESRVEKIADRLGYLAEKRDLLNLRESVRSKPPSMLPTTSLVDESEVFGRHKDKVELIDILLADDAQEKGIPVIAIVGIGGIGKTTLAQLVYNDQRVKNKFRKRGWAYVSEDFDVFKVTRTIYNSVTSMDCNVGDLNVLQFNVGDLNVLQVKLQQILMKKKYLLVLDNIWNENLITWDLLSKPLKAGARGSKIIVTTRNQRVATTMGASVIYSLQHLSDKDCWSVFAKHAFRTHNPEEHPTFKEIGESIVKKCQGLPLAAKTLGGLLHSNIEVEEWHRILNSKIWDIPSSILPTLRVSYYHLPSHLKECFAYCSIFPKGYKFKKEQVVLLWMAEGFLRQPNGNDTMEDVGDEYFRELLSRSLFQSSQNDLLFVMHDLVNDLAQYASGDFCFKCEDDKEHVIGKNVRHFAFLMDPHGKDGPEKFVSFNEVKSLRTFLPLTCSNPSRCFALSGMFLSVWLQKMKYLRVLSVSLYPIDELPDSLGKLTHLRFLDLSHTLIRELPSSICSLYNLQTLLLSNCGSLTALPPKIVDLINLRHLDVSDTNLEEMPCGFGRLTSLRVLNNFVVGRDSGSKISELGKLSQLRTLHILRGQNVVNATEASDSLGKLTHLRYLELSDTSISELPSSICSLYNLQTLLLSNCVSLTALPPKIVDLINLRHLDVSDTKLGEMPCGFGRLTSLRVLTDFVVGSDSGSKISELGRLSQLRTLRILRLQNVVNATEASGANLKNAEYLSALLFKWSTGTDGVSNGMEVLDNLQPHKNLEKLIIENYSGSSFPYWLGDPIFSNMVYLSLNHCRNCTSLPPLGQLSSLQELYIEKMEVLANLERGFYCEDQSRVKPFKSLKILSFKELPQWMQWIPYTNEVEEFPSLQELTIEGCPELIKSLPKHLCSLKTLVVSKCCKLQALSLGLFTNLQSLIITDCNNLSPQMDWGLHGMKSLTHFEITGGCSELKFFPRENLLPNNLTSLRISTLQNLENLGDGLQHLTSLETLEIDKCERLKEMPSFRLPDSLSVLRVPNCSNILADRCRSNGEDWRWISHIPYVYINDSLVSER